MAFGAGGGTISTCHGKIQKAEEHELMTAIAVILPLSIMSTFIYTRHQILIGNRSFMAIGGVVAE